MVEEQKKEEEMKKEEEQKKEGDQKVGIEEPVLKENEVLMKLKCQEIELMSSLAQEEKAAEPWFDSARRTVVSQSIWCQIRDLQNIDEINDFAKWLLEIGEGNLGDGNNGDSTIEIPNDLLIIDSIDPIQSLIDFVYPSVLHRFKDRDYFSERAILAPKNEVVHGINDRLLALFPGEEVEYLSSDSLCPTEEINDPLHQDLYNPDVLNSVIVSGLLNHRLVLKLGVPVMLLRNIDQQNGLCNGTCLQITRLGKRVIEAEILSGGNVGSRTYIPRISMIPSDKKIPFKFQRRQFPITVCFAMTINKSQGQSLSRVGLYLRDPVFSHGQLYVALSRVKTRDGVKLLIFDKDGRPTNTTANVVYKEIFGKL
ncbi:ATP-dependent DNA helicase PIF1-like [Helianthus annuus]|uniref:ATP-dependent DNA helicase PIF1-like n=1 Tax=Helianthus annuus TaxID=4232 RepID=UPI000B8F53B5|nr:ATP-dependent DNA helicase PIF1-like [Helianthus annuus]